MEIKAELLKPYTEKQRLDFIVLNNHQLGYTIEEADNALLAWGYTEEEKAEQRRTVFLQDFFKVEGFGYYRRQPKGYQSAVESMNVLFNIANVTKGLQAGLIIFYPEPDFTKPEECTEEWLVEHQIVEPAMTLEEFLQLYVAFMTAWNTQEHVNLEPKPVDDDSDSDTDSEVDND